MTSMASPTLQNSEGCLIFLDQLRSEICTNPSMPSSSSTNSPKLVKLRTTPFCFEFNGYRSLISAQGSCFNCFKPRDIFRSSRSMFKMTHSMSSPTLRKSCALRRCCDQLISETCNRPSTPGAISMNAP